MPTRKSWSPGACRHRLRPEHRHHVNVGRLSKLSNTIKFAGIAFALALVMMLGLLLILELMRSGRRVAVVEAPEQGAFAWNAPPPAPSGPETASAPLRRARLPARLPIARSLAGKSRCAHGRSAHDAGGNGHANGNGNGHADVAEVEADPQRPRSASAPIASCRQLRRRRRDALKLMTTRVLYIAGTGRSGSTLLANILGEVDGVFAAGEVRYLWQRGLTERRLCGCGVPVRECPVWSRVLAEAGHLDEPARMDGVVSLLKHTGRIRNLPAMLAGKHPAGSRPGALGRECRRARGARRHLRGHGRRHRKPRHRQLVEAPGVRERALGDTGHRPAHRAPDQRPARRRALVVEPQGAHRWRRADTHGADRTGQERLPLGRVEPLRRHPLPRRARSATCACATRI